MKVIFVVLGFLALFWYASSLRSKVKEHERKKAENYVFEFPKKPSPGWTSADGALADLAYDYGLDDGEMERIVRVGVQEAAWKYREEHPLKNPPSNDIDFINVIPYE